MILAAINLSREFDKEVLRQLALRVRPIRVLRHGGANRACVFARRSASGVWQVSVNDSPGSGPKLRYWPSNDTPYRGREIETTNSSRAKI